jgi:hypothetical protein
VEYVRARALAQAREAPQQAQDCLLALDARQVRTEAQVPPTAE